MLGMKLGPGRIEQPVTVEQLERWAKAEEKTPKCRRCPCRKIN